MVPWHSFYWLAGGVAVVALVALTIRPAGGRVNAFAYAVALGLVLLTLRWPGLVVDRAFNPDEDQFLAGAITLRADPLFWRSVDGQSAGPLVYYVLLPLGWCGGYTYCGARCVGLLMIFGSLWFGYVGLRAVWGDSPARWGILPAVAFFAFSTHTEFVHYSSEHAPMLLLAAGLAGLLVTLARAEAAPVSRGPWIGAGVALGAVPFAKLQAVPIAAALWLAAVVWAVRRPAPARGSAGRTVAELACGTLLVPGLFALLLAFGGLGREFGMSYLGHNLTYSAQGWRGAGVAGVVSYLTSSRLFAAFLLGALGVAAAMTLRGGLRRPLDRWALALILLTGLAALPVSVTSRHYLHYQLFLVMPGALLAGAAFAAREHAATSADPAGRGRALRVAALLLGTIGPLVAGRAVVGNPFLRGDFSQAPATGSGAAVQAIREHTRPGDRLAVWGWWAEPYVRTGLPQATSESNTWNQIVPSPARDYYRQRYLAQLQRNRPRCFLDAVGPRSPATEFRVRAAFGHETFPGLRDWIARNYELIGEFDGARLYVRRAND